MAMILGTVLFICVGALTYWEIYAVHDWYTEEIGCVAAAAAIGCIFAAALRLFLERREQENRKLEAFLTGIVFVFFFVLVQGHDWMEPYILLKTIGSAFVFASVGLYCLASEEDGDSPVLLAFFALCRTGIVEILLLVSLDVFWIAFDSRILFLDDRMKLLLDFLSAEFFSLLIGLHIFFASLPEWGKRAKTPSLFRALLMRVLWPVYLILLAILYLYVVRIVYAWEIPEGMMNGFASLALLAFSVFYFCFAGDVRYSLLQRFLRWGLLLFLPILIVQVMAVWQRVELYGLTPLRYASILCTIYGVFLLVLAFLRRSPRPAFLVLATAIAVFTLTPLNIIDVPLRMQESRLWSVLEENDMLQGGEVMENPSLAASERDKLLSASEYLMNQEKIEFMETPGMREALAKLREEKESEKTIECVFTAENLKHVPVEAWRDAYLFASNPVENGILVVDKGDGTQERFNVSAYLEELFAYARKEDVNGTGRFIRELRIDIDENTCLWLRTVDLSVRRNEGKEDIKAVITGVLLKKY